MEKIVQIVIGGMVVEYWRVSEEQWEALDALQKMGALKEDSHIDEISITLMN